MSEMNLRERIMALGKHHARAYDIANKFLEEAGLTGRINVDEATHSNKPENKTTSLDYILQPPLFGNGNDYISLDITSRYIEVEYSRKIANSLKEFRRNSSLVYVLERIVRKAGFKPKNNVDVKNYEDVEYIDICLKERVHVGNYTKLAKTLHLVEEVICAYFGWLVI